MKERPILFNTAMVQAILAGRKTQTRRLVPDWQLPQKTHDGTRFISVAQRHPRYGFGVFGVTEEECMGNYKVEYACLCPFGKKGDRLWVRETYGDCGVRLTYKADTDDGAHCMIERWTPSIHMPRSACRIILEITNVRVERLQDISEADARAEGCEAPRLPPELADAPADFVADERTSFARLWNSVYSNWKENPWVWVVEFKVLTTNGVVPEVVS